LIAGFIFKCKFILVLPSTKCVSSYVSLQNLLQTYMVESYIIDEVTEELSASEKALEHTLEMMNQQQTVLLAYLFSENFEAFQESEREFILFLSSVIWKSVFRVWGSQDAVTELQIELAEEANWGLLQATSAKKFRERLTVFFKDSPEKEDLLAFVEDALLEDDDSPITEEGREPIFVSLKTIIDCLLAPHS